MFQTLTLALVTSKEARILRLAHDNMSR